MGKTSPKRPRVALPRKKIDTKRYQGRVAVRLRALIDKSGLTTAQAAKAIGDESGHEITPEALRMWMRGDRPLPLKLFPVVAKVFGLESARDLLPPK